MVIIRLFEDKDAEQISALIGRDFVEINSKDYPLEEMIINQRNSPLIRLEIV